MSNKILGALFGAGLAALALSPAVMAEEPQTLAEMHADANDGCNTCHADGKPSEDGAYEFKQCQDCHGPLSEMDAVHKPHDGNLVCADCHAVHDMKVGERPTCDSCHDDGRTPDSILHKK